MAERAKQVPTQDKQDLYWWKETAFYFILLWFKAQFELFIEIF